MSRIKLCDAVNAEKTVKVQEKPELYARRCDGCEKIFEMSRWCNDTLAPGELRGTFDRSVGNNGFGADVCSFICAQKIFEGGWRQMSEYADFVRIGATLIRVELGLTTLVRDQAQVIAEWSDRKPSMQMTFVPHGLMVSQVFSDEEVEDVVKAMEADAIEHGYSVPELLIDRVRRTLKGG